jgi:predicted MFS family arabinose efflux permease
MLSHAAHEMGRGWGFGLAEALDQTGAMMGPLIVALVLYLRGGDYALGFAVLLVPALLAIAILFFARSQYPRPEELEVKGATLRDLENRRGFPRVYWLYLAASAFVAAGFADFPLMAFHFQRTGVVSEAWIPIFYAVGMGVGALGALVFGRAYDKRGIGVLALVTLVAAFFAPFAFFGSFSLAALGILLWGLGLGAHESLMKAAVADMVPSTRRASAYGVFNLFFGVAWFAGSAVLGFLYDVSILWLVIVSVVLQLVAVPMLWMLPRPASARTNG